jgi:large subunit ribosomal protein L14e
MALFDIGTVCVKTRGREAGKKCVIIELIDENYALVDGPKIKRKRCNTSHLEPTGQKLDVKKGAASKDVKDAFKTLK